MFESNADSWKGLCKLSGRREDVFRFKYLLMGRFVVCVGQIVCSGQYRDIVYFSNQNIDDQKYVRTLVLRFFGRYSYAGSLLG